MGALSGAAAGGFAANKFGGGALGTIGAAIAGGIGGSFLEDKAKE